MSATVSARPWFSSTAATHGPPSRYCSASSSARARLLATRVNVRSSAYRQSPTQSGTIVVADELISTRSWARSGSARSRYSFRAASVSGRNSTAPPCCLGGCPPTSTHGAGRACREGTPRATLGAVGPLGVAGERRWEGVAEGEDLLVRLATAIATSPAAHSLSDRLCHACRQLTGSDAVAITVSYTSASRVTLCATDEVSARLEDLQDVVGEGPGRAASESGRIEVCPVGRAGVGRWPHFDGAAHALVDAAVLHAVPMRPDGPVLGVLTLYQWGAEPVGLALDEETLMMLAAATGAALVRDPTAFDEELSSGPWASRA